MIYFVSVDQDVIQVKNYKNVYIFYQYLVNLSLEACSYGKKAQRDHPILKMVVSNV